MFICDIYFNLLAVWGAYCTAYSRESLAFISWARNQIDIVQLRTSYILISDLLFAISSLCRLAFTAKTRSEREILSDKTENSCIAYVV